MSKLYYERLEPPKNEILQYDVIPDKLRVQIIYIIGDVFIKINDLNFKDAFSLKVKDFRGNYLETFKNTIYVFEFIHNTYCRSKGIFGLPNQTSNLVGKIEYYLLILDFIKKEDKVNNFLTIIELIFQSINNFTRDIEFSGRQDADEIADLAIHELNKRFLENSFGFQFENNQIIKIDSTFIHAEAVEPVLHFLSNPLYEGAEKEFLKAHEHYKQGDFSNAILEASKAYESTFKIIFDKHQWKYDLKKDTLNKLIEVAITEGLFPSFWKENMTSLGQLLKSTIGTARNNLSGHGSGNQQKVISDYLASYVLHMTASTILFLVKSEEALN